MKITLAFDIFNKEATSREVVRSWIDTLSGKNEVEVIAVFDALRDSSDLEVAWLMQDYPHIHYQALFTPDVFEIKADNEALKYAAGDVIVFIQDDNLMHTPGWDETFRRVWDAATDDPDLSFVGATGLLAGVRMHPDFSYDRIECYRPHKHERAWVHGIAKDAYPLSVYRVDVINRPFAVGVATLRLLGGLDEAFCPMDWDDADLSLQLLNLGYTNLYIPFDVVNTSAKQETLTSAQMSANYQHGEAIARERWGKFVAESKSSFKALFPLTEDEQGRLALK